MNFSQFPTFWSPIEDELGDVLVPKVILTILGYSTKNSVASIRSKREIVKLEDEFTRRKGSSTIFVKYYEAYPFLQEMVSFPSGLQTVFMQIVAFLTQTSDYERSQIISSILTSAKQVQMYSIYIHSVLFN